MKAVTFPEVNKTLKPCDEHEGRVIPLPVFKAERHGHYVSCWAIPLKERFKMLITGKLWIDVICENEHHQPILPFADCPIHRGKK